MRNFILLSLSATIACSNQVPVDEVNIDNGDEVTDETINESGSQSESDSDKPRNDKDEEDEEDTSDPASDDVDGDGWSLADGDCDDFDDQVHPGKTEVCDGIDNDCDGLIDPDTAADAPRWFIDLDDDGAGAGVGQASCESPGAEWVETEGDCDDTDATFFPGAAEVCDGLDNDCDALIDEGLGERGYWYEDADGDGYGSDASGELACAAPSDLYVQLAGDCDDSAPTLSPGAAEICDGLDNDCDALIDEDLGERTYWYVDADRDGYGADASGELACAAPSDLYVRTSGDCNDLSGLAFPGATEVCDSIDNDCDSMTDEGEAAPTAWFQDDDGDGYGRTDTEHVACDAPDAGYVAASGDCNDEEADIHPAAEERCSLIDRDCDGDIGTGIATWFGDDETVTDMTDAMYTASGSLELGHSGTLRICEGEWDTRIVVRGSDVTIKGVGDAESIILDGHGSGATILARSSSERLVVREITVTGGDAIYGGGIRSAGSELLVEDAFIQDNEAELGGGGIYMEGGRLELQSTEVSGNVLTGTTESTHGAGIRIESGSAAIHGSHIYSNAGEGDVYGGGISMGEADLVLVDTDVEENEATMNGGGIAVGAGTVSMTDSRVEANESGAYGGGLKVSGRLVMDNSLVRDNTAQINGGGAYVALGDADVTPSLFCTADASSTAGFRGNETVEGLGGAVYSASTRFELESDTCDWGADGTENSPEDVRTRNWVGNAYGDASFECNASRGCGAEDDMWTRDR